MKVAKKILLSMLIFTSSSLFAHFVDPLVLKVNNDGSTSDSNIKVVATYENDAEDYVTVLVTVKRGYVTSISSEILENEIYQYSCFAALRTKGKEDYVSFQISRKLFMKSRLLMNKKGAGNWEPQLLISFRDLKVQKQKDKIEGEKSF